MGLAITADLALTAVKALLKYSRRVDTILSLNEASAGLPFALPPAPEEHAPHIDNMLAFFKGDRGRLILHLHGLTDTYEKVAADPRSREVQGSRNMLMELYFDAAEIRPSILGPDSSENRGTAGQGPGEEMRLAYYVVQSQRLSRNTALTRVLLATADTLIETAGENAGLFITNPKTRGITETLFNEFAVKHDFDDDSAEKIFKRLLGAAVVAASENMGEISDRPALNILIAAISDVRGVLGDDFVAEIISVDGFERLVSAYLTHTAGDRLFDGRHELAQSVFAAMLYEVGENLRFLIDDPSALTGIFEAGLDAAAAHADGILARSLDDRPLLAVVLSELTGEIRRHAQEHELLRRIAGGEVTASFYRTVLQVASSDPESLANVLNVRYLVSDIVSGVSAALLRIDSVRGFTVGELRGLALKSLDVLTVHPGFLIRNNRFATHILGAVLAAGADFIRDGLAAEDLVDVCAAAIEAASENTALADMADSLNTLFVCAGESLSQDHMKKLLTPQHRKDVLMAVLGAAAANPGIWKDLNSEGLAQPLTDKIFEGLLSDPTHLLAGPVLVDSFRKILIASARRGKQFTKEKVRAETLRTLLTLALDSAKYEVGMTIDGENISDYLERVVLAFLKEPFSLRERNGEKFKLFIKQAIEYIESR